LLIGLGQGLLHGLGPDHCAAMATLGTLGERNRSATFSTALRFALGHAAMLGLLAGFCLVAGVGLSAAFERWAEVLGAVVLLGLAVTALLFPGALRHGHPHLPGHGDDHRHARVSTAAGALMAISGVRSLLAALPPLLAGGRFSLDAWTYLPGFALGVLVGMSAVGLLFAETISRTSDAFARWIDRGVALFSGGLAIFWIVARF
jgi:hypothetical protein